MIFLPIVARELRVASRRNTTFIVRSVIALLGIVIGGFLLLMAGLMGPMGGKGEMVFAAVSRYVLLIALLAGVFLASDCLSEERREGTLGFLFLTDLKGYDVVLGKFAAVSLNAFYGMLAVFPVLAISFLAGGVSGGEFWRTCAALVNTLFFAVASSLWVSALCKSSYRAMAAAVCLLAGMLALAGIASGLSAVVGKLGPALFCLGALSPLSSFHLASSANYFHRAGAYWISLAICHGVGWMFLGLASWRLTFFREKGESNGGWRRIFARIALGGQTERRFELLDLNPVLWLLDDSRRLRWIAWSLAVVGGAALLLTAGLGTAFSAFFNTYLAWPFYFLLKVFFAIQACRFFSESRRTGALELLCCTPMTTPSIISGQWLALRRIFLWPVIVLILSQLACLCFLGGSIFPGSVSASVAVTKRVTVGASSGPVTVTNGAGITSGAAATPPSFSFMGWYLPFLMLKQIANSIADFLAVGWFGMWLALSLQKPGAATGLTILYVLILPAVVFCIPTLATDAVFIIVGYSKLQQDFRARRVAPSLQNSR
jgi:ABC-type transport system involved in multi-copper enzyme maturation permease subunit